MSVVEEKHWVPTRKQKLIATIEEFFGKIQNNQARILESRTTRTGIPYGPGGTVTPSASFFKTQPPNIGQNQKEDTRMKKVISSGSDVTAVAQTGGKRYDGSGGQLGESKGVHGTEVGLGGGHHGGDSSTDDNVLGEGSHAHNRGKIAGV